MDASNERIGVVGLGYVGLPLALGLGRNFGHVVGFDISEQRVAGLKAGHDITGEASKDALDHAQVVFTTDPAYLGSCTFIAVTVPTPIDRWRRPDLSFLQAACNTVGQNLKSGTVVVFESTVYPGVTEDLCGPWLEAASGLKAGDDFTLGYSPERINPGDREHTLESIVKVVSAEDDATLERVANVYGTVVTAGIHRAASIKVAEAAKVIENTQRDLNIALMNELALIFDRMDIRTADVLETAGTKWNFLPFRPGLVGGHCIGVDPYYLTAKAEELGYQPQLILAGRRINDGMGALIANKLVKMLIASGRTVADARVGLFGITFKEDVPDVRNTRVIDIVAELRTFGVEPLIHDPRADAKAVDHEYGLTLSPLDDLMDLDALVIAVPHRAYRQMGPAAFSGRLNEAGIVIDVRSAFAEGDFDPAIRYWSL